MRIWEYDRVQANDLYDSFVLRAKSYSRQVAQHYSDWEWYHLMQHYGLPTRLLDWTESALVGLYFALQTSEKSRQPCVWVLNPYWLSFKSVNQRIIFHSDAAPQVNQDADLPDRYLYNSYNLPENPIAIAPPYINQRITAQRSVFTLHGSDQTPLNRLWEGEQDKYLAQMLISLEDRDNMMDQVYLCGFTESVIFPDLEGLSRELRREYS